MFDVGQEVTVISDKGVAYDGYVLARATGDDGSKAYKVVLAGGGLEQMGQWHKACDVFVVDPEIPSIAEEPLNIRSFQRR
jgi:hypothetical protein